MDSISTLILVSAITNGVDPAMLKAICTKESNLKNVHVEDQGSISYGPCQVKRIAAKQVGLDNVNLQLPEVSIDVAAKYFKYMKNKCGGSDIKAIAAYNTGKCITPKANGYTTDVINLYIKELMNKGEEQ